MTLTPEQARQCRAEFEAECHKIIKSGLYEIDLDANICFEEHGYISMETTVMFHLYEAAWRPRPSIERMVKIMLDYFDAEEVAVIDSAEAIHRAMGGQE